MEHVLKRLGILGLLLLATVIVLAGIIGVRTLLFTSKQLPPISRAVPAVDLDRAVMKLSAALQYETYSDADEGKMNGAMFRGFQSRLETLFPLVHERLELERVNALTLVYRWAGREPERKAMLLLAHQDVVPAPDGSTWVQGPFSGAVSEGCVWGRGALDDKGSLIGLLEAVETLLEAGFSPSRDVYLCFGHDEEVGGWNGAARAAALLAERGVKSEFTLDEGMAVVDGDMLGVSRPIAFVSLTEKGYLSLELTVQGEAGHSSTPGGETAIGVLAGAVSRISRAELRPRFTAPVREMFRYVGPEMGLGMRAALVNLWLTGPLVLGQLSGNRATDALIRTTKAVTIFEGGHTENVLPERARAVVNFRLLPGDTVAGMTAWTRSVVGDDRVAIGVTCPPNESPAPSRTDTAGFRALQETVGVLFPEALVVPAMMLGGSDSHHYAVVSENTYGFMPYWMSPEDMERVHGPNECIRIEDFGKMIAFYRMFIETCAG